MTRRKGLAGIATAVSLVGAMLITPLTATPAAAADAVTIDRTSKVSVQDAYLNVLKPALAVPVGWTGNASTCTPGAQSPAAQAATFTAINYFRAMAGLPGVTESPAASTYAQAAAVMFEANGSLSHQPPTSWKCRTPQAVTGAGESNISLGFRSGADAVAHAWVDDAGVSSLGHRKWVLYPATTTMGAGHTTRGGALKVFGEGIAQSGSFVPVAWPSSGFFPYEVLPSAGSWWSYAKPGVSMTNAQVSVTKNGAALSGVSIGIRDAANPYAMPDGTMPTVSWKMPVLTRPAPGSTDTYHVKITGISPIVEYDVKVFSAETPAITGGAVTISGSAAVGATLTAAASGFSPTPTSYTYQWLRDDAAITGATGQTYVLSTADAGKRISVSVTAALPGYTPRTVTSGTVTIPVPVADDCGQSTSNSCAWKTLTTPATTTLETGSDKDWLRFTAPTSGAYTFTSSSRTSGADPIGTLWRADGTTQVATDDDAGGNYQFKVAATLAAGQVYYLEVKSWNNGRGAAGAITVTATVPAAVFTGGSATISGTAKVGSTLTATPSGFSPAPASYAYQWLRDGTAISGATGKTYVVTAGDQGKKLSVRVTASKPGYTAKTVTSSSTTVATAAPGLKAMPNAKVTVSGSVYTGQTRTAQPSGFASGSTLTYRWSVGGAVVVGATKASYRLPQSAAGKKVTVTVTGTKPGYATTSVTSTFVAKDINQILTYQGHVQNIGWQGWVHGGQTAGTSGRSLRVEALRFRMDGEPVSGSIQASAHVQNIGWMTGVGEGQIVGTQGRSLRVEAFTIRLTGKMASQYDVWYRTHAQDFGWLGWTRNGAQSGSAGYSRRLEAVQVMLLPAGSPAPGSTKSPFHSR